MRQKMEHCDALNYILGGKATITVQNVLTKNRFTFQIKENKKANFPVFFVKVLNGPDNTSNYLYIGSILNGRYTLTKGSKVSITAQSFRTFEYIYFHLVHGTLPSNIEIFHHGHCSKCGKKLTVPESIKTGMGPVCSSFISKARKKSPELF